MNAYICISNYDLKRLCELSVVSMLDYTQSIRELSKRVLQLFMEEQGVVV